MKGRSLSIVFGTPMTAMSRPRALIASLRNVAARIPPSPPMTNMMSTAGGYVVFAFTAVGVYLFTGALSAATGGRGLPLGRPVLGRSSRPAQLSGGQRQRVGIGRALVRLPDVLLMDEPLSNIDAELRGELRAEIQRLQRRSGTTTFYVTHDQPEALALAYPAGADA